jgi:glycosyltransferase involved in cell wall biosynthesis
MKVTHAVLISPGAVDSYPPVQYQARCLADAGITVEIVSAPLGQDKPQVTFSYPGVRVSHIPAALTARGRLTTVWRSLDMGLRVLAARLRCPRATTVEICYDPVGVWMADRVLRPPALRIAHFHELLQHDHMFVVQRLPQAIRAYDHVVVPDVDRGAHTRSVLGLDRDPIVIENYPMRSATPLVPAPKPKGQFEVIYCGSLGIRQRVDLLIQSVPDWPEDCCLVLIGRKTTATAKTLQQLATDMGVEDRVHFLGWMDLPEAEARMAQANLGAAMLDGSTLQWRTALGASNKRYQLMKVGLPQIGDDNPGVFELIEGNGVGSCIQAHTSDEITRIVRLYHDDPARCLRESHQAAQLHQTRFNYETAFDPMLELLGHPRRHSAHQEDH